MTISPGVRRLTICLALWFALVSAVRADETFATLKVGDVTYTNVTVTMVTATDIYFTSTQGMANAKLDSLEPAMQSYFGYDSAKAGAAEQARQAGDAEYLHRITTAATVTPAVHPATNSTNRAPAMAGTAAAPAERNAADIQADTDAAMSKVRDIVNQPVDPANPPPGARIGRFPYWFGGDFAKPDFKTADVRATQQFPYAIFDDVSSDLDRSRVFPADQLESNSLTMYFYTDLSVPKKKLTAEEMQEINRLYRIIGTNEDDLSTLNGR
jgi:hypothetical protein